MNKICASQYKCKPAQLQRMPSQYICVSHAHTHTHTHTHKQKHNNNTTPPTSPQINLPQNDTHTPTHHHTPTHTHTHTSVLLPHEFSHACHQKHTQAFTGVLLIGTFPGFI